MSISNEFLQLEPSPDIAGMIEDRDERIIVADVDAHYAQAIGAGAKIIIDIQDDKCGRRSYSCRDLHGHIWNFSSYNPQNRRFWIKPIY